MSRNRSFRPEWVSAPGETIADILAERGLSIEDLRRGTDLTLEEVDGLMEGRISVTLSMARRLTDILGGSHEFWMSRDYQYREDISRSHSTARQWLRELPVADMIRFGWIRPVPHPVNEAAACLAFFDLPSVESWRRAYRSLERTAAFRTSRAFDSRTGSVAAWLRRGEIEAEGIAVKPWDPGRFEECLVRVRGLTRVKDPAIFLPNLQELCAEAGVAVTVVRAPAGCRASGAVRFLTPSKALVQLSFRFLSDDHFWFTFFHEAGHLLIHGKKIAALESLRRDRWGLLEGVDSLAEEDELAANEFASQTLIPPELRNELEKLRSDSRSIIRFSVLAGVSPGIVVGQLQHIGRIGHNRQNFLKRQYDWGG